MAAPQPVAALGLPPVALPQAFLGAPVAHRALHDRAAGRPENSRAAIRAAVEAGELGVDRLESFLRLDEEIEELQRRAKKRRMATERWAKRNRKVKARNLEDRIDLEREQRGEWR